MIEIDPDRLMRDLRHLATFGKVATGVDRTAFSKPDIEARRWLLGRMQEAGLAARVDGVGNVMGRTPGDGPAVLIGSHTDSVPKGGWLDGSMGVIYGLEIARAAIAAGDGAPRVDVISFEDEEGTFKALLGSGSLCGEISADDVKAAKNLSGRPLGDVLAEHGLADAPPERLDKSRYAAYLEAHIEQGPRLEAAKKRIGVVTGIVGIRRFNVAFEGQADHAGTTPMAMRKDAGAAAIAFADDVFAGFRKLGGDHAVWNIGKMAFEPGAANVVPSRSALVLECRDLSLELLDRLETHAAEAAARAAKACRVSAHFERTNAIPPAHMDKTLGAHIAAAAAAAGAPGMAMPSGAGHDAMMMARHLPSAMLFVPSIGGRSHDVAEDTNEADIVLGCRVLAGAVERILAT